MKTLKKIIFIAVVMLFSVQLCAQTPELSKKLKGLTQATPQDLMNKKIKLGGDIPVFTLDGKRITENEISTYAMSSDYLPKFYLDAKKDIKLIVLHPTTKDEKAMIIAAYKQKGLAKKGALVGKKAPDFSVKDMNGKTYKLSKLKGKTVVINFWFIKCKPCVKEMPELNKLVDAYKDNANVVFLGIATDKKAPLKTFLKQKEFAYTIVPDGRKVTSNYNIFSYPTHIVIDKNGVVQFQTSGLSPATIPSLEEAIEKSL